MRCPASVLRTSLACLTILAVTACEGEVPVNEMAQPLPRPQVQALSSYEAAVGDEIEVIGDGFVDDATGWTEVTFRGVYQTAGGSRDVQFTTVAERLDDNRLIFRFGPYQVPFSRTGAELGTFRGEIFATNHGFDGREQPQNPAGRLTTDVAVRPSLVIRDIEAVGDGFASDCNHVGTRLINFVPYRITVETVGFEAEQFTYSVSAGAIDGLTPSVEPQMFTHLSEFGPTTIDTLGELEELRFGGVPIGVPVYRASISVEAQGTDGNTYSQFFMVTVHSPISVRYDGRVEFAELMEPVPVSGCIPGGFNGREVAYSESTSETRTLSTQQTFTSNWTKSYSQEHEESYGEGGSEANKIGFASADEANWNWNVNGSVMAGGEAGIPFVTKGKVELRGGFGRDWGGRHTDTRTGEQSWTKTASYNESVSMTEQVAETISEANSETWTVSSENSEALAIRTWVLPNHFGVFYRQTTRLVRRGQIIAMDLCGNESIVGEMILNDYTWAPALGMETECPPFPVSDLPAAECLIPPCEN